VITHQLDYIVARNYYNGLWLGVGWRVGGFSFVLGIERMLMGWL